LKKALKHGACLFSAFYALYAINEFYAINALYAFNEFYEFYALQSRGVVVVVGQFFDILGLSAAFARYGAPG
jgi:hypothetical protein